MGLASVIAAHVANYSRELGLRPFAAMLVGSPPACLIVIPGFVNGWLIATSASRPSSARWACSAWRAERPICRPAA